MLTSGVVGIGNAGSQVAALAFTENMDAVVINSSENDLSTVPDGILKYPVGDLKGSGKNRAEAKQFLKDSIRNILVEEKFGKFMKEKDIIFIVSSTGGGTGSGIAPVMTQILKKSFPDVYIILVGILPTINEAYSTQINTLEYTTELYKKLDDPTYMLYDNEKMHDKPSHIMMDGINKSIVEDMKVLMGVYNNTTKYSSIDEKDMSLILSSTGRIVVCSALGIKEKDLDNGSIDDFLLKDMKTNSHAEIQLDMKIRRSGVIANMSESMSTKFDDHLIKLQETIGHPVEEFIHLAINPEKSLPNNVYFIAAGLSPITDRIEKINERVAEIDAIDLEDDDTENVLSAIDIDKANARREYKKPEVLEKVDVNGIISDFM